MGGSKILYNNIGSGYNATRQADPFITEKLCQFLTPQTDGVFLDIGCGTGNYTIALANKGLNFYGLEPSEKMLDVARAKNDKINWLLAKAEQIPLNDNLFDGAIATLTIHHWTDIKKAFSEIHRVLKDGSGFVFFTATPDQMKGYWLNHYFPKMLEASVLQMPSFETIANAAVEAGFVITGTEKYFIQDGLMDHFLYAGKNRPELYFEESIRKGISSFSALAYAEEVLEGLSELGGDIKSGRFKEIKEKYDNDMGDYLFITAKKN
ncbi:MAG: class I SAM-dependent methyltransferase [Sphingobacteriales bacterium]